MYAAELKIIPVGAGSSMEQAMERVAEALDDCGIHYAIGPLATDLEAEKLDDIFAAARAAHDAIADSTPRIYLELAVDHRLDKDETLQTLGQVPSR